MKRIIVITVTLLATFSAGPPSAAGQQPKQSDLDQFFQPPAEYADDFGDVPFAAEVLRWQRSQDR